MTQAAGERVEGVLSVMNRAISEGARPEQLVEGAREGDQILVEIRGANPDEDARFALRVRSGSLEMLDPRDPGIRAGRRHRCVIRLDDFERMLAQPDHYAAHPDLLGELLTR